MKKSGISAVSANTLESVDAAKARFFYAGMFALKRTENQETSKTPAKKGSSVDSRRR